MSEVWFSLPPPPEGSEWCGVCAAFFKAAVIEQNADRIKEIESDGETGARWIAAEQGDPGLPALHEPVTTGISVQGAPVMGTTGLCWTHVQALTRQPVGRLEVSGPLPPGLVRGKG